MTGVQTCALPIFMHASELGVTPDLYEGIAQGSFLLEGGYKKLTHEEVIDILKASA